MLLRKCSYVLNFKLWISPSLKSFVRDTCALCPYKHGIHSYFSNCRLKTIVQTFGCSRKGYVYKDTPQNTNHSNDGSTLFFWIEPKISCQVSRSNIIFKLFISKGNYGFNSCSAFSWYISCNTAKNN